MADLTTIRERVETLVRKYHATAVMLKSGKKSARKAKTALDDVSAALALAQEVAERVQEEAHAKLATVVTRSLETVFGKPYKFIIRFEQKRGRTEAVLAFERDGLETDPLESDAGGVVDVAAFALRLSCLMLSRPPLRRLLVLDEPFKMLSVRYRPALRELLENLSSELGVQIVMVTHMPELACGKVITLSGGETDDSGNNGRRADTDD